MWIGLFSRINAGKLTYEHILRMVGVLILVHENITELMPVIFAHLWATLEQFDGAHDQIVKIHGIRMARRYWYSAYITATSSSTSPAET